MKMKWLTDKFSMNMFIEPNLLFTRHELNKNTFNQLKKGAYSCVGGTDIAEKLGVNPNREPVRARSGDIILVAHQTNYGLKYYCIQVCENTQPLTQSERIVEELI